MHLQTPLLPLTCLLTLASAHFELNQPTSRGPSHDNAGTFPCAGLPVSQERTKVPLDDPKLSIGMKMGHDHAAVQVLLALGSEPGENFNITLVPTLGQRGLGDFCLPDVQLGEDVLGIEPKEGLEATVQVVTNGDPMGGLYNCADIVFTASATSPPPDSCKNGTGVTARPFPPEQASRNANESTANGGAQSGSGGHGGHGGHGEGAAVPLQAAGWGAFGAAVLGAIALL
ncbi:hypothetical protein AJ79_07172 [Helicocarpus griseus UAMH5409]|uniref:Copper acquisition factor BIM1-like domain-containing protein n=1 Tax=Helicocarpus griseus UAMH5409 TaxID=1447875 RepID=A0A2B7WXV4_9EURO|nr:hypothetical protein AJ79_07172 [Helicocarpus griseus UAMH5409]